MRILVAHNYYQQRGGEDVVFEEESRLLEAHGHFVSKYIVEPEEIENLRSVSTASNAVWSSTAASEIAQVIRAEQIDVAHFHNLFPLISPASLRAAHRAGAAVVHTLHNFRPLCPKAILFREGKVCLECVPKIFALPGIIHQCYHKSRPATAINAFCSVVHRTLGTFGKRVDAYIAPTEFVKEVYASSSLGLENIRVKPHFVERDLGYVADPIAVVEKAEKPFALFVGRLSEEKGLQTLLKAWRTVGDIPLRIIGDGPMNHLLRDTPANIQWLGWLEKEETYRWMGKASCLVLPSSAYETFGKVIAESFCRGTPVITTNHGGQRELVTENTGRLCEPNDAEDLAKVVRAFFADSQSFGSMRKAARKSYEKHFSAAANYESLIQIYRDAIQTHRDSNVESES